MSDCGMHGEKFFIEGGVTSFRRGEHPAEECEWLSGTM